MKIERQLIPGDGFTVPCVVVSPSKPIGAAVITHGYGGCKEEQLGLAWRVAEIGLTACVIDLRGHGENGLPMDEHAIADVEAAVQYCGRFGDVTAIGHSLGGRLSMLSHARYAIGLSPALNKTFSVQTQETIKTLRSYRVQEKRPNINFETLSQLPEWEYDGTGNARIFFGSRDVPEIVAACGELREKGAPTVEISKAMHNDIFLVEETIQSVISQLKQWYRI